MNKSARHICFLAMLILLGLMDSVSAQELNLRSRVKRADGFAMVERKVRWEPKRTALIICDMWDDHWCKSAAKRVGELAGPMNEMIKTARAKGVFIIHAPSSVTAFY